MIKQILVITPRNYITLILHVAIFNRVWHDENITLRPCILL